MRFKHCSVVEPIVLLCSVFAVSIARRVVMFLGTHAAGGIPAYSNQPAQRLRFPANLGMSWVVNPAVQARDERRSRSLMPSQPTSPASVPCVTSATFVHVLLFGSSSGFLANSRSGWPIVPRCPRRHLFCMRLSWHLLVASDQMLARTGGQQHELTA